MTDLTTLDDVVTLLESSQSEDDWNDSCDKIKSANGGSYPDFWWEHIIQTNFAKRVSSRWGGDDKIRISIVEGIT